MPRVIAGSARRAVLVTVDDASTRPTTDRIKETLFNILQPVIPGCRFLDLFAGSGQIAIEALSRGADHAVLVESGRRQAENIRKNLEKTRFAERAVLWPLDVSASLVRLGRRKERFDVVYMDPPYGKNLYRPVFRLLREQDLLAPGAVIIAEADRHEDFSWLPEEGFRSDRIKLYKTNQHVFAGLAAETEEKEEKTLV